MCGCSPTTVVEDQPEVRAVARAALTRHGYTVLEANQGEEALQIIQGHHEKIHLLLTDVVMPAMSGRELARRLLEEHPHVRTCDTLFIKV
jgi:two-component system cell cycle sensor histidine kinase/response regulator CckA